MKAHQIMGKMNRQRLLWVAKMSPKVEISDWPLVFLVAKQCRHKKQFQDLQCLLGCKERD